MGTFAKSLSKAYDRLPAALVVLGLAWSFGVLAFSWNAPLLDQHAFRQTQTALTADWMARGGPWLAYQTPVMGAPWTIPFEFPLFQWVAVLLHKTGLGMDQAGRLASWLFFIASLPPAGYVIRALGGDRRLATIFQALWLLSPLYVFWSRAFMIESCAVFLAMWFLAGLTAYLSRTLEGQDWKRLAGPVALMAVAGVLAALVKITTFFVFALAGGAMTAWMMWRLWRERRALLPPVLMGVAPALSMAVIFAALSRWVAFADELKAQSPIGATQVSSAMRDWVYGSAKIMDPKIWDKVIFDRALEEIVGSAAVALLVVIVGLFFRKSWRWMAIGLALYLAPYFVFTNLHWVHNYYQYANGLFAVLVMAGAIWAAGQAGWRKLSVFLLLLMVVAGFRGFFGRFAENLPPTEASARTLALAERVKQTTTPDEVSFVFGYDWSSEIAHYSDRRVVTVPTWASDVVLKTTPQQLAGGPIGAVVDCPAPEYAPLQQWIAALTAGRKAETVADCTVYR